MEGGASLTYRHRALPLITLKGDAVVAPATALSLVGCSSLMGPSLRACALGAERALLRGVSRGVGAPRSSCHIAVLAPDRCAHRTVPLSHADGEPVGFGNHLAIQGLSTA